MYRLVQDRAGYDYAIEKDGVIVMHLYAGAETTVKNAKEIVQILNDHEERDKREFLFRTILDEIADLGCMYVIHQLHDFVVRDTSAKEFRLPGKFGFGFKLRKSPDGEFYFDQQYPEEVTEESKMRVNQMNESLKKIYQMLFAKS